MSERKEVTTYFLEMAALPAFEATSKPEGADVVVAANLSAADYRQLYLDVGAQWLWYERADMEDDELDALIHANDVSLYLLIYEGSCAGYSEMRRYETLEGELEVQILYFGLKQAFIGKGLGRFFLEWSVRHSFGDPIKRLWVHTCSLDHERALATYESAGFREFRREYGWVQIPQQALDRKQRAELAGRALRHKSSNDAAP